MAQIKDNKKGFKVIQISRSELVNKLGEYGGMGICDSCGKTAQTGYYIAVLNRWFCPHCYIEWNAYATYYDEDKKIEEKNFNYFKSLFGI